MKNRQIDADAISGIVLLLISGFFYVKAGRLLPEAAMWPKMLLIVIVIIATLLTIKGVQKTLNTAENGVLALSLKKMGAPLVATAFMTAYAVCMMLTGFFVSTAIFLPLSMFLFNQRRLPVLFGVTVGVEAFVYWLFVMQLSLRMP